MNEIYILYKCNQHGWSDVVGVLEDKETALSKYWEAIHNKLDKNMWFYVEIWQDNKCIGELIGQSDD